MVFNLNQQAVFFILSVFFVWLGILSFLYFKLKKHYNRLIARTNKKNLSEILEKILTDMEISKQQIEELQKKTEIQKIESLTHIQKVGLLRFNPFNEVGSDQSFVLALLNGENDGVVLTSLHGRTGTRWYGKTISKGQGKEHELSHEEKETIRIAEKIS